jgi:NAD(P)H-dependent FMN reductase
MARLLVIVGSTRPGRVGLPVGEWITARARGHAAFDEVDFADLGAIDLPLMDEPNHPRLRAYTHQHTRDWSARVDAADAIVLCVAEYNYGYTAPLKNAIDYLHEEWKHKPVGFVSYGGIAAGTRALQQLKQVVTTLKMLPLFEAVNIPFVAQFLDDEGAFAPSEILEQAADTMLDELARVAPVLAQLRAPAVA